jgi:histidinol-phosphate aminotransferase
VGGLPHPGWGCVRAVDSAGSRPSGQRLDAAVPRGALPYLTVYPHRLGRASEQRLELRQALSLGRQLEERLLDLVPEIDPGADLERQPARPRIHFVHLHLRSLDDVAERVDRPFHLVATRILVRLVVVDRVDFGGGERAAFRQLDEPEALAALHDDVQASVVELLYDLYDRSPCPDRPEALVVGQDEPELHAVFEALADQLLVALLEDVKRPLLPRKQHEVEREQADLVHSDSLVLRLAQPAATKLPRMAEGLVRSAISKLVPYEPGKPVEEVQRELGLDRVVKLASNEGQFGPFPSAREALERGIAELNRYPDGGSFRLRHALAEKHGVGPEQVALAAGADAVIMYLSIAALDPGDEIVCGWPSFPSYVLDAVKLGAVARQVPLDDYRYDPEAMLGEITPRTKLVYLCNPNNPTGTMISRAAIDAYFERVPDHVLTVLDEAYFEYVDDPDYPDGLEEYLKRDGRRVLVLRTFSKIYGLAGLRVGYGVGPADVVEAIGKVRNAFDVSQPGQDAALASLGDEPELARRRDATAAGRSQLVEGLAGLPVAVASPAVPNFIFLDVGADTRALFQALLHEGVIVRPLAPFGAPSAVRVTVGTDEENQAFLDAFARVVEGVTQPLS